LWGESDGDSDPCGAANVKHRFELSDEQRTLTLHLDREHVLTSGKAVRNYSAKIVESSENLLTIIYNEDAGDFADGAPREWQLIFDVFGNYRWRASSWDAGRLSPVIGYRCGA
jgi:hypothetical protein